MTPIFYTYRKYTESKCAKCTALTELQFLQTISFTVTPEHNQESLDIVMHNYTVSAEGAQV